MEIKDEGGDKNFFTIVPNYIINHSNAIDRALYVEMKRFAGENGQCYVSEKKMIERLKIGRVALHKSIKYLLEKKWIRFIGKKSIPTQGGNQKINIYSINDIWRLNSESYKGVSETAPPTQRGVSNDTKGVSETAPKKNNREEDNTTLLRNVGASAPPKTEKYQIISCFLEDVKRELGISCFADTTRWNRIYASNCLKKYGREKTLIGLRWMIANWQFKPLKLKTVFYGMEYFLEAEKQKNTSQPKEITLKDGTKIKFN